MKSARSNQLFRIIILLLLLISLSPSAGIVKALPLFVPPPVDMFQWPWEQGLSWVAFDGFDNGTRRLPTSPHNYIMGGAIDFAPHNNMVIGEDTSNFWVTAAAAGTVVATSSCHLIINHGSGWLTEYWHLDNIQVSLGAVVSRNQRLAVIADNEFQHVCTGNEFPGPHLHFVMRPKMIETIFSGWTINYNVFTNVTTFTKDGQTVGRNQPILNVPIVANTATPTLTASPVTTSTPSPTGTPSFTSTPTATASPIITNTPSPTGTPVFTSTATSTATIITTDTFTPTGTILPTNTPVVTNTPTGTLIPTNTVVPTSTLVLSSTPTPTAITEPYVLTSANPLNLIVGATGLVTVSLNNIPVGGYTSAEFTCTYNPNLVAVSNITVAGLFGADPVSGMLGPQSGSFILAIAGSNGNRAMVGGTAFTFNVQGLQVGQTTIECTARVSEGLNVLQNILSIPTSVTITAIAPTATVVPTSGTLTGQVLASKLVTIRLRNPDNSIAATTTANPNGTFSITAPAGTYTVVASADGFLDAQGPVTIVNGNTVSKPIISLIAGDIDNNDVIDQFDVLTIGINYNGTIPPAADLNNDGVINVLDLGILAQNYGASGALAW